MFHKKVRGTFDLLSDFKAAFALLIKITNIHILRIFK